MDNPLDSLITAGSNQPLVEALGELHDFCKHHNSRWYSIKPVEQVFVNIFDDGTFAATDHEIESFNESVCNTFEEFVLGVTDPQYDYTYFVLSVNQIRRLFDKYKDLIV